MNFDCYVEGKIADRSRIIPHVSFGMNEVPEEIKVIDNDKNHYNAAFQDRKQLGRVICSAMGTLFNLMIAK